MVKFMLDAGHSYNTPGKRSIDGSLHEWSFNSVVAKYVADLLAQYENTTTYFAHDVTGARDVPLQERTDRANQLKVDSYISFHANAGPVTARGLETFVYPNCPPSTVALGMAINKSLIPTTGMQDRGLKRADFHVLRETKMDAVLIEHGFMTNDQDLRLLKDDSFRHKCAEGTVNALVSFYGLKKKQVTPPPVQPAPVPQPAPVLPKKRYVVLPASEPTWRIYPLDKAPVKANALPTTLKPSRFGGLEFEILKDRGNWVFEIQTRDFGRVQIFANPAATSARVVEK